jgi:hypothetical protein
MTAWARVFAISPPNIGSSATLTRLNRQAAQVACRLIERRFLRPSCPLLAVQGRSRQIEARRLLSSPANIQNSCEASHRLGRSTIEHRRPMARIGLAGRKSRPIGTTAFEAPRSAQATAASRRRHGGATAAPLYRFGVTGRCRAPATPAQHNAPPLRSAQWRAMAHAQ